MLARRREHCQGSMQPELAQLMFAMAEGSPSLLVISSRHLSVVLRMSRSSSSVPTTLLPRVPGLRFEPAQSTRASPHDRNSATGPQRPARGQGSLLPPRPRPHPQIRYTSIRAARAGQ